MDTLLRHVLTAAISESGRQLRKWIGVLDELAETRVLTSGATLDMPAVLGLVTDSSIDLAISITQAHAGQFKRLVDYAVAVGLPGGTSIDLQAHSRYKALITNPHGVFLQMCDDYRQTQAGAADGN